MIRRQELNDKNHIDKEMKKNDNKKNPSMHEINDFSTPKI
jgi:hypothetical protein